jgi:hypothetical protein
MPTIDIFIKSYRKDFHWLQYCLMSIKKNVSGYNNLILLIPEVDKEVFDTRNMPDRTLVHYVKEYGNGFLFQQWCKINAPAYSHADYILFADSDCFFDRPIDLATYLPTPEILYTEWSKVGDAICWKGVTESLIECPYEFMRRNCLIYHRDTLARLNEYFPDLELAIMASKSFSEFNLIGAYAYKFERDRYNFINTDNWQYTEPKAIQFWSHATKEQGASELQLREYIRILETLVKYEYS